MSDDHFVTARRACRLGDMRLRYDREKRRNRRYLEIAMSHRGMGRNKILRHKLTPTKGEEEPNRIIGEN